MSTAFSRLAQAIAARKQPAVIERFLLELLTPGEAHDLALRWELVELLVAGVSQRQIASRLGISLCKITRGAKILKKRNGAVANSFTGGTPRKSGSSVPGAKKTSSKPTVRSGAKSVKVPVPKKAGKKAVVKNGTRIPGKSKDQARR